MKGVIMSQTASKFLKITDKKLSKPILGALFMLFAAFSFALVNSANDYSQQVNGVSAPAVAFFQYLFASIFALPWILREGRKALATKNLHWHILRVILSAIGVQAFVASFTIMPFPQIIALVMISPFFVIIGAGIFLREKITFFRVLATIVAFSGAMIILEPWTSEFSFKALLPLLAALVWAGASLITKYLTFDEKPATITVYLLILLTPINLLFYAGSGFAIPAISALWLLIALGVLTALAQYFITKAYSLADAAYLQPFDDLKLPINTLVYLVIFGYALSANFWPGALLIISASLFIALYENRKQLK